ncbi:MAG: SMP-30/gluconolactonase/LRE family protein [Candidatus Hydrogenedentes bacterium]|nr:SMP-30/gluconolactonase/LRE family protein [Candidatus Hydrogenedentota bacterium]
MLGLAFVGLAAIAAAETVVTGPVELVADGFLFTEGPVWLATGELVFSDIPKNRIYKADKTVFREPSNNSNGLVLDNEGRLIACEHSARRVTRTEKDGAITVLAEKFEGKKLNSPNDATVRADGTIFFTDPPYGIKKEDQELDFQGVYTIAPDGKLSAVARDFKKPNGIGLSPDGKTLYVADTEGSHIRAFDVAADGSLANNRVFCELPHPDGLSVDQKGYVWCTAEDGVRVLNPKGELVHTVAVPQGPANCGFGDADGKTLYITARTGLYKVRCATPGLGFPAGKK